MTAASTNALLRAADESLRRGHWRVACRRYLMLLARQAVVPEPVRSRCELLLQQCSAQELARMQADARRWAAMMGDLPEPLPQRGTGTPIRTQWRPLPKIFAIDSPASRPT